MKVIVTGGAGFIGCNLAISLARRGDTVVLADNLSRPGSAANLESLMSDPELSPKFTFVDMDVRDADACHALFDGGADGVAHLAAQVSVTSALVDPIADFEINARGTLNMLEAVRLHAPEAHVLYTSTNKVYGSLADLPLEKQEKRYVLPENPLGVSEDFACLAATPYGVSKYVGDLYMQDYAYTFGLNTTVFRMSCIYGTRQNGNVDQGWVSWMVKAALTDEDLTIYGDGCQVRDLLHVDDLVRAITTVLDTDKGKGRAFNMGGGAEFSVSIWAEFSEILEGLLGHKVDVKYDDWRPGDQRVYISDIRRVCDALSWQPTRSPADGIAEVLSWVQAKV
ncbi:MAG TPA: GDP-mannose 4,6-dehydratase [Acidimicrobiales bacterium]|jgi:CDP-paratose 2-epimerase